MKAPSAPGRKGRPALTLIEVLIALAIFLLAMVVFGDMIVRNGVADLWGTISDVAQREGLKVLVAGTPGVKKVEDHLTWQTEQFP